MSRRATSGGPTPPLSAPRDARRALDAAISEHEFMEQVIALAQLCGFLVYHTHDSRRSWAGYPDLTLVHPERGVFFWELKSERGRVRAEQVAWANALSMSGAAYRLFRPSDWPEIEATLKGGG